MLTTCQIISTFLLPERVRVHGCQIKGNTGLKMSHFKRKALFGGFILWASGNPNRKVNNVR